MFAPTDQAFAAYLDESGMTQDQVFTDPEVLRSVLGLAIGTYARTSGPATT